MGCFDSWKVEFVATSSIRELTDDLSLSCLNWFSNNSWIHLGFGDFLLFEPKVQRTRFGRTYKKIYFCGKRTRSTCMESLGSYLIQVHVYTIISICGCGQSSIAPIFIWLSPGKQIFILYSINCGILLHKPASSGISSSSVLIIYNILSLLVSCFCLGKGLFFESPYLVYIWRSYFTSLIFFMMNSFYAQLFFILFKYKTGMKSIKWKTLLNSYSCNGILNEL